jgi:hypothetical protein
MQTAVETYLIRSKHEKLLCYRVNPGIGVNAGIFETEKKHVLETLPLFREHFSSAKNATLTQNSFSH